MHLEDEIAVTTAGGAVRGARGWELCAQDAGRKELVSGGSQRATAALLKHGARGGASTARSLGHRRVVGAKPQPPPRLLQACQLLAPHPKQRHLKGCAGGF